ncbi:DUF1127 domain-containing protein [Microbaculum marinum]|uniref:DUF1127 domain-containing protein n=1 Tax=Microbaculum marinum TaxID=1764581 RepID=A0AAW9RU67_9HYPH
MHTSIQTARIGEGLIHAGHAVLRAVFRLWRAWSNRRQVAVLLEADDHMLRDIGLTRGDVVGALSGPADMDPSHHLIRARAERLRARAWQRLGA